MILNQNLINEKMPTNKMCEKCGNNLSLLEDENNGSVCDNCKCVQ